MTKWTRISVMITLWTMTILAIYMIILVDSLKTTSHDIGDHVNFTLSQMDTALSNVQAIELNTTRTEAELSGLLNTTRHIAMQERQSQAEQLRAMQTLMVKGYMVLDDLDQTVKQVGAVAPVMAESIQDVSRDVQLTLRSSQKLLEATTDDLSSPAIKLSMERVQDAAQHTAETTQNLADATKDIKDYVHRETAPVRGTWNFIKEMIGLTWSIRGAGGF